MCELMRVLPPVPVQNVVFLLLFIVMFTVVQVVGVVEAIMAPHITYQFATAGFALWYSCDWFTHAAILLALRPKDSEATAAIIDSSLDDVLADPRESAVCVCVSIVSLSSSSPF